MSPLLSYPNGLSNFLIIRGLIGILDSIIKFIISCGELALPKNRVCLLVGVKPKGTTKPKSRRRKNLLLAASRRTQGIFPKAVYPNSKIGEILS